MEEATMMGKYVPYFERRDETLWLVKYETKDYLYVKTNSLSIKASALEQADMVEVHLPDGRILIAKKSEIKAYKDVKTWYGETKYYYPMHLWHEVKKT